MGDEQWQTCSPQLARIFLERCLPRHLRSPVIGDLEEIFSTVVRQKGRRYATGWYWDQALRSVLAHCSSVFRTHLGNIKSEFETAARSLVQNRRYSVISIAGLTLAVTCCLLIALYVVHEKGYDLYHKDGDRIFRVHSGRIVTIPKMLAESIVDHNPHVQAAGLIHKPMFRMSSSVRNGNRVEQADGLLFGNSGLFRVFSWRFLSRTPWPPLDRPFSVVVTRSAAARMFGDRDPLGATVEIANHDFTVTGVIENIPENSHFTFEYMASLSSADSVLAYYGSRLKVDSWQHNAVFAYLKLDDAGSAGSVARHMETLHTKTAGTPLPGFSLLPLTEVYFTRGGTSSLGPRGNTRRLVVLTVVFFVLLLVAGTNVVNLVVAGKRLEATAATDEGHNGRWLRLYRDFVCETLLITALAATLALLAARLLLPMFNGLFQKQLSVTLGFLPWLVGGVAIIPAVMSVFAVSALPARPEREPASRKGAGVSSGYHVARAGRLPVAIQMAVACVILVSTVALTAQVAYLGSIPLGYETRNLLVVPLDAGRIDVQSLDGLRKKMAGVPGVEDVTVSVSVPGKAIINTRLPETIDPETGQLVRTNFLEADRGFVTTYNIPLKTEIVGANPGRPACLINESLVKAAGWENPADARGNDLVVAANGVSLLVVGVVGEFHHFSRRRFVDPALIILNDYPKPNFLTLRLAEGHRDRTPALVIRELERFYKGTSYFPYFLDEFVSNQFEGLIRLRNQYLILSVVVLVIALGGLLGYGTFVVQSREEEIYEWRCKQSRPMWWILVRLYGFTAGLAIAAVGLGLPLAVYLADKWLSVFPNRSDPGVEVYAITTISLALAGLVAVCLPALRLPRSAEDGPVPRFSSLPAAR
jgi:putative ABC transport system permease protein